MAWPLIVGALGYPNCAAGLTCRKITPADKPELTFDCAFGTPSGTPVGHVYCLHGNDGVGAKGMFAKVMLELASHGYASMACDARGFSPGARPTQYSDYNYNVLITDIFSLVDEAQMHSAAGKFHMVAHDQGARISWHSIAKGVGRKRFLTFTSLSIPHSDVFSDSLYGSKTQDDEQKAAQYVRIIALPNSTIVYNRQIATKVCPTYHFAHAADCQRALWYYNGAVDSGAMAMAKMLPFGRVAKWIGIPEAVVRNLTQYSLDGVPQTVKVGPVGGELPVFFACGENDESDLCSGAAGDYFESGTRALVANLTYMRMTAPCGHDVLGCSDVAQVTKLVAGIVANVMSVTD